MNTSLACPEPQARGISPVTPPRSSASIQAVITTRRHSSKNLHRLKPAPQAPWLSWMLGCRVCVTSVTVHAGPLVSTESPIGFFTNVANRMLQSQLNLSLNRIQLYPTNQYTPSVHRLLQVTANLYDALTNRTITDYPYLPSVFRPLFTNDSGMIYITGYAEETGTAVLSGSVQWRDPQVAEDRAALQSADMVYGVPVIIGAKKGFPNFNEFGMQTLVQVARKLQLRRPAGSTTLPVDQTNQMFVVTISNVFGIEAWNSYGSNFPRNLRTTVMPDVSITLTNEAGALLVNQRFQPPVTVRNLAAGAWPGYDMAQEQYSFQIPFFTNLLFLTNSTYARALDQFVPLTGVFETVTPAFYVPHWWLNLRTRLRFALIDTAANRIVDLVNLDSTELPLDITDTLMRDSPALYGQCGTNYTPSSSDSSMWCTNHYPSQGDENLPTYGILNQLQASLGLTQPDWNHALREFPLGLTKEGAIDFFRYQFDLWPLTYFNTTFYKSNTFNAPFQPIRNIYLSTTWQANDPLVHYTVSDLTDLRRTNRFAFDAWAFTLPDLGRVNQRYEPWAGNPAGPSSSPTKYDMTVKDPHVFRPDDWDFATNQALDVTWLGRVHRGTPWQTIYLKTPAASLATWVQWTGNAQLVTNSNGVTWDAFFTQPTNDWRLASLLVSLLSTNDPRNLAPVNQAGLSGWCRLLDGMTVLTNDLPDDQVYRYGPPQLASVIMSSNSPQASTIAAALVAARATQPDHLFHGIGDILATPELSTASPWLNVSSVSQLQWGINDEAYEAIPSQLLPLLRPDSIGSVSQTGGALQIQFTGADGYAYAVQVSSNLLYWTAISTNYPVNGSFNFVHAPPPGSPRRFYRSLLQP